VFPFEKLWREGTIKFDGQKKIVKIGDYYHGQVDKGGKFSGLGRGIAKNE
jgi:hypothetical protein